MARTVALWKSALGQMAALWKSAASQQTRFQFAQQFEHGLIQTSMCRSRSSRVPLAQSIPPLSTGISKLDRLLEGGYPRGGLVEIYGHPGTGKTTLAFHAIHSCQQEGKIAVYLDLEHNLSTPFLKRLPFDTRDMLLCQPNSPQQAFALLETCCKQPEIGLLVLDSVAGLQHPTQNTAIHAFLSSRLRRIIPLLTAHQKILLVLNPCFQNIPSQAPSKPTSKHMHSQSKPTPQHCTTTLGGLALHFYARLRVHLSPFNAPESFPSSVRIHPAIVSSHHNCAKISSP
ncbi:MAG: ATPase domain-containing protein [Myxococcota bacterium]